MSLDSLQSLDIIEVMENFLEKRRPPLHIRPQLDIGYKIEGQSIIIHEIRPKLRKPEIQGDLPIAKTTFVKAQNHWKIFWMRSDLQWHSYTPKPTVKTLADFVKVVDEDKHCCFWG